MFNSQNQYSIPHFYIAIIIAALIIGGFIDLGANTISNTIKGSPSIQKEQNNPTQPTVVAPTNNIAPTEQKAATIIDMKKISLTNVPFKGKKNAPIVIVNYSDFQCPFCERYYTTVEKQLIKDYVDSGKARLYFKPYAFLGADSETASEGLWCANEQGKFWEYHDYLFENQGQENGGWLNKDNLKKLVQSITGINAKTFATCLDSNKFKDKVAQDLEEGKSIGVNGTPQTFINGETIPGAQDYNTFKKVVEKYL